MTHRSSTWLGALVLSLLAACGPVPRPPAPAPTPVPAPAPARLTFDIVACAKAAKNGSCSQPIAGAMVRVNTHLSPSDDHVQLTNADGYTLFTLFDLTGDASVFVTADGYRLYDSGTIEMVELTRQHNLVLLLADQPPFPPPPTRDEALNLHITFQGLVVHTQQYGDLPWFEAALAWLDNPADRQAVYAAKHASTAWPGGDTHAIIHIPFGPPLYDEPNQPYSADRFGPRDWTAGMTHVDQRLKDLVAEVRAAGFVPLVFLGGDGPNNYPVAIAELPLVLSALERGPPRDLRHDVVIVPGWDSVFYGWEPSREKIPGFARAFRALCADCYLAIEHGTGHIPIGEGDADWVHGGDMQGYDLLLSEFNDDVFDDSVWQIAARTIGPAYRRPSDQPASDDPHPPFYLREGNARGRFYACAFEFHLYTQVHRWPENLVPVITKARAYFQNIGYSCGG